MTTKRVKCSVCGKRTRSVQPDGTGLCSKCQSTTATTASEQPAPQAAPTPKTVKKPVPVNGKTAKTACKAVSIDNPFRAGSAQYAYFEILRDGKFHTYEELNAEPKAKFPRDLIWFMHDAGRKAGTFSVTKEKTAEGAGARLSLQ